MSTDGGSGMQDLTAVAEANAAARTAAAQARIHADTTGRLADFHTFAQGSVLSTTVTTDKVVAFEDHGEIVDTRRFFIHAVGGDEAAGLREFARHQGPWQPRRRRFEGLWRHGRRFVYGVVDGGGHGLLDEYGSLCLVVEDPEDPRPDALGLFPDNTAERYTLLDGSLDARRALAEAAPWSCRAGVAVVEREQDALATSAGEWPKVLCQPERFLEVARAGVLPVDRIREVRVRAGDLAEWQELQARVLMGERLTDEEAMAFAGYDVLRKWQRRYGTAITAIPDAEAA